MNPYININDNNDKYYKNKINYSLTLKKVPNMRPKIRVIKKDIQHFSNNIKKINNKIKKDLLVPSVPINKKLNLKLNIPSIPKSKSKIQNNQLRNMTYQYSSSNNIKNNNSTHKIFNNKKIRNSYSLNNINNNKGNINYINLNNNIFNKTWDNLHYIPTEDNHYFFKTKYNSFYKPKEILLLNEVLQKQIIDMRLQLYDSEKKSEKISEILNSSKMQKKNI